MCVGGGGGGGGGTKHKKKKTIGTRLFFVLMLYIKFQVPVSSFYKNKRSNGQVWGITLPMVY